MLSYQIFPVTSFAQNCSLVWCTQTQKAALIDPGGEAHRLLAEIQQRALTLDFVLLTHGHLDHVGAAHQIRTQTGCPVIGPHEDDRFLLQALPMQAQMFGLPHLAPFLPDQWLIHGQTVTLGNACLQVRHCPGHTPGHIVLLEESSKYLWGGDVLFAGSIGRTDFPRGDHPTLLQSITREILSLADDIVVIPGHGPNTTIGHERKTNPFLQ